jgi:hypothetical protein
MAEISTQWFGADPVLDDAAGQDDAAALRRGQRAEHEIFSQVLQTVPAADLLQYALPSSGRWPDREFHSLDKARDWHAGPELGVRSGRFQP